MPFFLMYKERDKPKELYTDARSSLLDGTLKNRCSNTIVMGSSFKSYSMSMELTEMSI